jgi:hypothetical protein
MSGTSIHNSATEPSFFYVLMAQSCFRRAASTRHPKAGGTLRQSGRDYLAKANGATTRAVSELQSRRVATH